MKGKSDTVPSQENRQGIDDRHQKIVSVLAAHKVALWEYDIRTGVCSFDEDYFRILGLTEAGVEISEMISIGSHIRMMCLTTARLSAGCWRPIRKMPVSGCGVSGTRDK